MTLGEILKSKRIESGRSLEQVAASTKIHVKILAAIEEDRYGDLPARAFTRGFIVNYAKSLRLNPETLLAEHHDYLESKFLERANRDQGHQGYAFEGKELEQNKRWMMIGAGIALVFAVGVLLVFKPQNHKRKEKHKDFEEEAALVADAETAPDGTPLLVPTPSANLPVASASTSPSATATTPIPASNGTSLPVATENKTSNPIPLSTSAPLTPLAPVATSTAKPTVNATATATATATPKPTATATATPKPTQTPTPSPTPKASPTATPASTATPAANATAVTSPTPTAKLDPLRKGDSLDPKEVKKKVTFQAKEDVWVRYQSDSQAPNLLILRKGRSLVVKGKEKITVEVTHPENLQVKQKGTYEDMKASAVQVEGNGTVQDYTGAPLGTNAIPAEVPAPRGN